MRLNFMAAAAALLLAASAASATTYTSGTLTLKDSTFGSGLGVHANGTSGMIITGDIGNTGDTVTLMSSDVLNVDNQGGGLSKFDGPFSDLLVTLSPLSNYSAITFSFDNIKSKDKNAPTPYFDLIVNGGYTFSHVVMPQNLNGFQINSSDNTALKTLAFKFYPDVADARQFRLEVGPSAAPEPSMWALMILGFGTTGAMLRRRQLALA